ncbi:hypothetical protein N7451_004393 [Penicillium sp. IBT 35674x]|nr:hypothetical protein N7451_004393 [Penicillium sp. IBT 35674x]
MSRAIQPCINWDNKVQPLVRCAFPEPPPPVLNKSLAAKVQEASRHPWGLIDHHLYLAAIERGRDCPTRLDSCMLQEGERFRNVCIDELLDINASARPFSTYPHLITFMNMPMLPLSTLAPLTEQKLVLGFDLQRQLLLGYFFESAPDDLADLCYVWHQGQLIIDIHIDRFLEMYQYTVKNHLEICGVGMFRYFRESKRELPTGMDLVVTIQFAQFLHDFAELVRGDNSAEFRSQHADSEDYLRTLLSKASWESWFAVRDGLTLQQYRQKKMDRMSQLASCDLLFDRPSTVPSIPSAPPLPVSSSLFPRSRTAPGLQDMASVLEHLQNVQTQMLQAFFALMYVFALIP